MAELWIEVCSIDDKILKIVHNDKESLEKSLAQYKDGGACKLLSIIRVPIKIGKFDI